MLNREVFPINYHKYWESWHRLGLVSGNRDPQRPYSLRVGAGSKLDGATAATSHAAAFFEAPEQFFSLLLD
ncbi:hypothetical protein L209DRAFT_346786 [Thermothelomyces heterothallicus CBS 203.75]